jgi:hypothetical protein
MKLVCKRLRNFKKQGWVAEGEERERNYPALHIYKV